MTEKLTVVPLQFEDLPAERLSDHSAMRLGVIVLTLVVSGTPPLMTWYSSGSRYLGTSSAISALNAGVCSEGFRTAASPAAIALICMRKDHDQYGIRRSP